MYGALTVGALGVSNNIGGLTTSWHSGMLDGASALEDVKSQAQKLIDQITVYQE